MLRKIGIHGDAVCILGQMRPVRLKVHHAVPLLEKQNVRSDFRTCIGLKCSVGKPHRTKQVCPPGQVLSDFRACLVHGSLACDKSYHPSGPYFVQRLCKEIVMDQEIVPVISLVCHLVLSERHVSDGCIKEIVGIIRFFKTRDLHISLRVKLSCDPSGDTVQLHPVKAAFRHRIRQHAKEISDAHGRLQNIAPGKSHLFHGFVHAADNDRAGVMGV